MRSQLSEPTPLVIRDLAHGWPALQAWSPDTLSQRFGDKRVRVYDGSFGVPGDKYMGSVDEMSFARFLTEVLEHGRDLRMFLYNIGHQIPELLDEIEFPDLGMQFSRRFVFTFFGCKGSTTPLHYDIDMGRVIHTVIRGRRRVRLFAPGDSKALYRHPCTVRSYVDLDRPDLARFPALAFARGFEVVLEPGESLYMPPGYWHEFHYLEAGMGLSLRAPSQRWRDRLEGVLNMLLLSPSDRVLNRLSAQRWFSWKETHALSAGDALVRKRNS